MKSQFGLLCAFAMLPAVLIGNWPAFASSDWPSFEVVGPPEAVLSAEDMNCASRSAIDVPDEPPNAFRRSTGEVVLLSGNRQNHFASGPTLARVKRRDCASLLPSDGNSDPSQFRDQEWLMAVIPLVRGRMLGLVHDEYHGDLHDPVHCPPARSEKLCWYAATTMVFSNDDGRTFKRPAVPQNVVAAPSIRYQPGLFRQSLSTPKAITRDGYIYAMAALVDRNRNISVKQCLLRASLNDPGNWFAWDGAAFGLRAGSPYVRRSQRECTPVLAGNISSLKYLSGRRLFVALSVTNTQLLYEFSHDLLAWSPARPLMPINHRDLHDSGCARQFWYFSLLDPNSNSNSFDTISDNPYLYAVRFRCDSRHRDVVRFPIRLRA